MSRGALVAAMLCACSQAERLHVNIVGGWGQAPAPEGAMDRWIKRSFSLGCHREKLARRDGQEIWLTCSHVDGSPAFHIFPDGTLVCDIDKGQEASCESTWRAVTKP